ncbi:MAG: hypothetical protein JKX88_10250 [Marinicaulis sp.]|nr:hypothetical protein [Marinicaulis sp.]
MDLELPFLATENVLMEAVKAGGDRQDLHERIRVHTHAAARAIKDGGEGELPKRLAEDPAFGAVAARLADRWDEKASLLVGVPWGPTDLERAQSPKKETDHA